MTKTHRELILEEKYDEAPGQKIKQYILELAECIQLKPVQATKIHLVDSISVHSNIKQRTVLPTERVIVYFLPKSYIAKLSIYHYRSFHISPLVCVLCDPDILIDGKCIQWFFGKWQMDARHFLEGTGKRGETWAIGEGGWGVNFSLEQKIHWMNFSYKSITRRSKTYVCPIWQVQNN